MGCGGSKNHLDTVDDSVHVMLKHDKAAAQKQGKAITGYVPRAEHPLLAGAQTTTGAEAAPQRPEGSAPEATETTAATETATQQSS